MNRGLSARVIAVAIVATWVFAQSAALVEASSTIHARCLEHGDTVHAEGAQPVPTEHLAAPDTNAHEHCELSRALASVPANSTPNAATHTVPDLPHVAVQTGHFYIANWRWAPKNSPPTV